MSTLRLVPGSGHPVEILKEQTTVGRDPNCDVVVTDGSVSRRHARIELRGSEWWVVDEGSANGTYINSVRIAEQALRSGQELRFGALAFRVEAGGEEDVTVATPAVEDDSAVTLAPSQPAPARPAPAPPGPVPPPMPPPPPSMGAAPPPLPPPAASRPTPPRAPVPQMRGGPPPAKKGRSPLFWIVTGCCGCLLLGVALVLAIGGGVYMATKPAADAAHAWLDDVRQNRNEEAVSGLSSEYRQRLTNEEFARIVGTVQQSTDATFFSRSIDNDRAQLHGVLTGRSGSRQPIRLRLAKEGGEWKVDDVQLAME